MKASLCVGEYCENAYNVEGLDIRVYSMEELCYCLKENAFLLDLSIMNDKLVDWIGEECKVRELAKQLYPMVHKQGSLSVFVVTILQYVGMYDPEEILQVEQVLKQVKESIPKTEEEENQYTEYFGDMMLQEYASAITDQGSLGIAQKLYESMKNNMKAVSISEAEAGDATSLNAKA